MSAASIDTARDAAQQMVTACLHSDRGTASQIAQDYPDPLVLALVLADLVAHVHHRWSTVVGMGTGDRNAAWAELMADVEEWRAESEER